MYTLLLEKRKRKRLTLDTALILIALFWISRGKYFIALLLVIVAAIGFYINRKKIVVVSKDYIRYPFFIEKEIQWEEVANVLLKDDILTIDLKNNKLLQSSILPGEENIDENEFNTFCKNLLS